MQDEPERGVCFSHKMSLKGRGVGMLGIDRPRAKRQQVEPATDPAVSPLQRRDSIQRQRAGRDLRLGGAHAPPARLQPPEPRRQRAAAAVSGQDDRTEPGANHAADPAIPAGRRTPTRPLPRHRFARKYTPADVELLAAVDEAHETLSGPATRKILEREYQQYQQREYERLAGISVAQIYRLRRRSAYRQRRLHFTKTRPTAVSIGERRRPDPQGQPGFLRVDTVHQGDRDGVKASTTSMPWMKSPSGKWSAPQPRSVKPGWSRY